MVPFRTTAVIPLSPYLQIHSHHSFIPFIPSRFHCVYPSIHNNPSPFSAAQRGKNKIAIRHEGSSALELSPYHLIYNPNVALDDFHHLR